MSVDWFAFLSRSQCAVMRHCEYSARQRRLDVTTLTGTEYLNLAIEVSFDGVVAGDPWLEFGVPTLWLSRKNVRGVLQLIRSRIDVSTNHCEYDFEAWRDAPPFDFGPFGNPPPSDDLDDMRFWRIMADYWDDRGDTFGRVCRVYADEIERMLSHVS